ncbi:MAG: glycosyltransferase family 4 protein [Anaerolineae bacterium]|nr:glycosyltransferase family 4 protein [Anaerolineae bacterium]
MHILFLTPGFPPLPGGGERYAAALARQFTDRGHTVTVVTSSAETEGDFWHGSGAATTDRSHPRLTIIRCPVRPMLGGWPGLLTWRKAMVTISTVPGDYSRVLSQMSRQVPSISGIRHVLDGIPGRVDIVNGFNISWENTMFTGWQWARQNDVPFVATPFMHFGAGNDDRVQRNALMDHQRLMLRNASAVLTLTDIEAQGLLEHGIVPQRVETIGGGLDPLPRLGDNEAILRQYDIQPPYLIYVGRASQDKGAIHAAQAAIQLKRTLVLVGQRTPEYDSYFASLNPSDKRFIRHLGIVSEVEKHTLLHNADMLLLPSRIDSFGIVLLEAWAHKIPVIGANAGGIPGVITDGVDGLLVPYGDVPALMHAIRQLAGDVDLRRRLGTQGHAQLKSRFNWKHVSEHVLAIYADLLAVASRQ